MYGRLASVYEDIFPLNPLTLDFIRKCLLSPDADSAVLDVGCATGELCRALSERGYFVIGVEPDTEMVAQATALSGGDIPFFALTMEAAGTLFQENSFSTILCLGNTLAHLPDLNGIQSFFIDVSRLLAPGGRFIFQIVNFDRISREKLPDFPVIERRGIRFTRRYEWPENRDGIRFITTLETRADGTRQRGECRLFPAKKAQLSEALLQAGFARQSWFGNYQGAPFAPDSPAAICVATIGNK